jgi:hypothetical protein
MNSVVSLVEIGKLDGFIRKQINDLIGGPALSKDLFYTATKCGGLGLKNLRERYFACKFNNLAHFLVENEETRNFVLWQIEKEGQARRIKKLKKEKYFFDWDLEGVNPLKGGYHSLIAEVFHAADQLQIGISYDKDNQKVNIWTGKKGSLTKCKKGETAGKIGKILQKRHFKELKSQKCRGKSICTFKNSRISNFYITNYNAPMSNALIRFALRCRNDTLWTPARKALIYGGNFDPCCKCGNHRYADLLHIINNCAFNMEKMTKRHNMIQLRMVEAIVKYKKITREEIHENQSIKFEEEELKHIDMVNYSRLRPDLWYWIQEEEKRKLIIIEISVPFGKTNNEIDEDSLKVSDRKKRSKYAKMIRHIQGWLNGITSRKFKYSVHFQTIIVSSIGAIPNFTLRNLSNIIGSKKVKEVSLWGKRLVVAALRGSFEIWMNASPMVFEMMQPTISINEKIRRKERLIEVDEENPDVELLKEVVNAETECKEIEELRSNHESETENIKEFYEPELAESQELENEQERGVNLSDEMTKAEDEEFEKMITALSDIEVEKRKVDTLLVEGGKQEEEEG